MGRRGRHPDPNSKRTQAALARAAQVGALAAAASPASGPATPRKVKPPASVSARPAAARFWKAHAADLEADGRLTADRAETFGLLAHLFADAEQLAEQIASEGWITATDKGQAVSPVARLLRDSRRDYVMLAREFGLTAAAAGRIPQEVPSGQGPEEGDDQEASILARLRVRG
jgi:phage terminase small subunit